MAYFEPGIGKTIGIAKHFYLKPGYRKSGLMSKMYYEMVSIAKHKGVEIIELQCYPNRLEYWKGFGFKEDQHILRMVI
jgi:GNAT superfamily N-acetyltransferase